MKCIVVGNCQVVSFAEIARRMVPDSSFRHHEVHSFNEDFGAILKGADVAFVQPHIYERLRSEDLERYRIIKIPRCSFSGFHPDIMYLNHAGGQCISPASHHSALIFGAWWHGLDPGQTATLFGDDTFTKLRFPEHFEGSRKGLLDEWARCGLDGESCFNQWMARDEPFMLTMNHPKLEVMLDAVRATLDHHGFEVREMADLPHHHLLDLAIMPVYPDIAARYGMRGSTEFIRNKAAGEPRSYELQDFISICFRFYRKFDREKFAAEKVTQGLYKDLFDSLPKPPARKNSRTADHPYRNLPDHQNWRRAFSNRKVSEVDPVVECNFRIGVSDKVATAGSCFAQHLARALSRSGLCYYAPEAGERSLGYGLFSARYGNIYTAAQLSQLIDRAYGAFSPVDVAWQTADGGFVDPFRPEVTQVAGASIADVEEDRVRHFGFVREVFENMDYFVFTLGLTESWRSRIDGAVFPLAPGVHGGAMDAEKYEFVNFGGSQTRDHLFEAIRKLRDINPAVKIILTVSPVPLKATYVPRHVLVSTTYSKAVLRVAAEEACEGFPDVFYFPSYEIITGSFNRGHYYEGNLRTVTPEGVDHVMRLFLQHGTSTRVLDEQERQRREEYDVFCAEELLDPGSENPRFSPRVHLSRMLRRIRSKFGR